MMRHLHLVLGDQLTLTSSAWEGFDATRDIAWMAENDEEATQVWSHQYRLVAFFAPMRHFCKTLLQRGYQVDYHALSPEPSKAKGCSFASLLKASLAKQKASRVIVMHPGDYRVLQTLRETCAAANVTLEIRADHDFFCSPQRFQHWAANRKSYVLEQFYRMMRTEHDILMDGKNLPVGGEWNYDKDNRNKFPKSGPGEIIDPPVFAPDAITKEVMAMVAKRFADHPGTVDDFDLPVTREQALESLADFIKHRLPNFGRYQDAMWHGSKYVFHSRLSHSMNLHLLNAQEVVDAAVQAYNVGDASLASVEGFVRQILGWREYVRGIYWHFMPQYETRNSLDCPSKADVPEFFWNGKTQMACVADAMRLLLSTAYAHHIQRLMVLGLYAQLSGVHPHLFHQWHMAMYADAVDWVSLPNALGMSQHGDGGLMATKPYCASGNYINGMSNYCKRCPYQPKQATGEQACPFTTLYWDFLDRHQVMLKRNPRMTMQLKNLQRKSSDEMIEIRSRAKKLRSGELEP